MTSQELRLAQRKLADDVAEILRTVEGSYFEQVFLQQFPGSGISECEIENTQREVGKILTIFKARKMVRQSSRKPKDWELATKKPDGQLTLFDMHSYPD